MSQAHSVNSFNLGDVRIYPLVELERLLVEPTEFFPKIAGLKRTAEEWYLQPPYIDAPSGRMVFVIQAFLISSPSALILVDACVGNNKLRERREFDRLSTDWLDRFRGTGFTPEDVDMVILTHLHVDHVGWATKLEEGEWVPTFQNARYLAVEAEYKYWSSDEGVAVMRRTGNYLVDSVTPLIKTGLLGFVEPNSILSAGIRLCPGRGHTPGNTYVEIDSADHKAILAGDVLTHPMQCAKPDWSTRFCTNPDEAAETRRELLRSVANTDTLLVPTHFALPSVGRVYSDGDAYRFEYAPELAHKHKSTDDKLES